MYLLLVYCLVVAPVFSETLKNYKDYKHYEVQGSREGLEHLKNLLLQRDEFLIHSDSRNSSEIILSPHLASALEAIATEENLRVKLLHRDVSEIIQSEKVPHRRFNKFSWDAYYDVDDIHKYIYDTSKSFGEWTEIIEAGESYEGRKILGLRINTRYEKGQRETGKPVFFIESGIHAREWIAPAVTTYFINQLLTSRDPNVTRLRDQFDWRIFPTVNPDGYHYSYTVDRYWRKTRSRSLNGCRGADPNRNWDYNWGQHSSSTKPCDYQLYAGSRPFSEVETRSLSKYISTIDNLLFYVAFHSYASVLLVPYSDSFEHVDNYDELVQIGRKSIEYGSRINSDLYDGPDTAAATLYKASGGSMDWVRHALGTRLVYTYELRGSSFHWPAERISEQGDEVTLMMMGLADGAQELGYF
ncbi:zinc carboxypeptidase-like [Colias croceus]|uniref:zinc carboxypeptidase-like n=1 Tax=Colias crocea TaxID=72248 RepID=UPI001E27BE57|nr:zinc carboxypeptidase-like [Colias croceus]